MVIELNGEEITGVLKSGSRGEEVKILQTALGQMGYSTGGVDGVFGPKTLAAVKAFQKARGLSVDGVVGPETTRSLGLTWRQIDPISPEPVTPSSDTALTAPMTDWSKYLLWGGVAVLGVLVAKKKGWLKRKRG